MLKNQPKCHSLIGLLAEHMVRKIIVTHERASGYNTRLVSTIWLTYSNHQACMLFDTVLLLSVIEQPSYLITPLGTLNVF
jgi:hypothetical protein